MKLKIIGKKEDNIIPILRREERYLERRCEMEACCYACCDDDDDECCDDDDDECCDGDDDDEDCCYRKCSSPPKAHYENYNNNSSDKNEVGSDLIEEKKIIKKEEKLDLNEKERIMKMVGTQNFVEGFWEDNEYTKEIKNKYQKEYEQIKGIKNKNMNDNIALTILIIYFLNKEHPNLMSELIMIIKKAKQFISKQTKDNYDNIIKEIGLN